MSSGQPNPKGVDVKYENWKLKATEEKVVIKFRTSSTIECWELNSLTGQLIQHKTVPLDSPNE